MGIPTDDLQSIAGILAAGHLRHRDRLRRETRLANSATSSVHGHEVNGYENGDVENAMREEIDELSRMTVGQLRLKYVEAFGEESRSNHRQFLFRRIAWRVQALAEGGLSERARLRALEIANDADLRIRAPRMKTGPNAGLDNTLCVSRKAHALDPRLPPPGTYLEREYKGQHVIVKVLVNGFEFDGRIYRSLSAIARKGGLYAGEHERITDRKAWDKVHETLRRNGSDKGASVRNKLGALLRGLLFCVPCGTPVMHTYTMRKSKRYRYYVCFKAQQEGWQNCETKSVSAQAIETAVLDSIRRIGTDPKLSEAVALETLDQVARRGRSIDQDADALRGSLRQHNRAIARQAADTSVDSGARFVADASNYTANGALDQVS